MFSKRVLHWRIGRKHQKLMDFTNLVHQYRRSNTVPHAPPGDVIGFSKRRNNHAALRQLRVRGHPVVRLTVENDVFIHFVRQNNDVRVARQRRQLLQVIGREDLTARVVRRIDDDHPRARGDGSADLVPVDGKIRHREPDGNRRCPLQADNGRIAVKGGLKVDHLIPRMHQPADGGIEPFAGAGGHQHLAGRVILRAVERGDFIGNALFERLQTGHRRVLVMPLLHGPGDARNQLRVTGKIRCALRKVNGVMLRRELADNGKNGGTHIGQFGARLHGRS